MIWDKMSCINGWMVKSNLVISLVLYQFPNLILLTSLKHPVWPFVISIFSPFRSSQNVPKLPGIHHNWCIPDCYSPLSNPWRPGQLIGSTLFDFRIPELKSKFDGPDPVRPSWFGETIRSGTRVPRNFHLSICTVAASVLPQNTRTICWSSVRQLWCADL